MTLLLHNNSGQLKLYAQYNHAFLIEKHGLKTGARDGGRLLGSRNGSRVAQSIQRTPWVLKLSKIKTTAITISWWIKRFLIRNSYFFVKIDQKNDQCSFLSIFSVPKIIQMNHRQKWKSIWLHFKIRTPNQFHNQNKFGESIQI